MRLYSGLAWRPSTGSFISRGDVISGSIHGAALLSPPPAPRSSIWDEMGSEFVTSVICNGNRMHADGVLPCQRCRFQRIQQNKARSHSPLDIARQLVVLLRCTLDLTGQGGWRVHWGEIGSAGRPIALTMDSWDGKVVERIIRRRRIFGTEK
jgi:hypothetical protein